jgi:hypothetical protein
VDWFQFSELGLRVGCSVLSAFNNIQVKDLRQFEVVVRINESSRTIPSQEDRNVTC